MDKRKKEKLAAWVKAHKKEIVFIVNHKLNQALAVEFSQEMINANSIIKENGATP